MNFMLWTAMVATRPSARWPAKMPPEMSICASTHPPKISPLGLVSAGMASVRVVSSPRGFSTFSSIARSLPAPSNHEGALLLRRTGVHVAAAVEVIVDLGGRTDHAAVKENVERR